MWAPDGTALYYGSATGVMKVDVETDGTFSFGRQASLFPWVYDPGGLTNTGYDIHPDGDRFLFVKGGSGVMFGEVYIVVNWFEELRQRMAN